MNVSSLKTALKRYAGLDDSDPLIDWLNAAYHEFEDAYEWPWLEVRTTSLTGAIGSSTLTLPSDFFKVKILRDTTDKSPLEYMPQTEFFGEFDDLTSTGQPMYYTTVGFDQIVLWPTLDRAVSYNLIYQKALTDLVLDTDVPAMPARWHYGLVFGAAAHGLQSESEEERSANAAGKFTDYINRAISKSSSRNIGEPDSVREVMDYDAPS